MLKMFFRFAVLNDLAISRHLSRLLPLVLVGVLAACDQSPKGNLQQSASPLSDFTVYKREQCGCCNDWITHIEKAGYSALQENVSDFDSIKDKFGIPAKLRSCHTSVSQKGYLFEGHIPAKFIRQFLEEKPVDAIGLAVPAMPTGSPGMEFGDMFMPYTIYLIQRDGSYSVYASVKTYKEQF
ncbi:DUF411 domain-containing protein [Aliikangiella sp. G2MR2-5]|uniref:DUF411 domain-containing protein n=1 Tax=Aliikangiella sp. G2MR2-5 TaxID=2788943 RepID=UPI001FF04101|nr:DUF411 domain-containing protein [Aliikangiella sp. G2MR2-5]